MMIFDFLRFFHQKSSKVHFVKIQFFNWILYDSWGCFSLCHTIHTKLFYHQWLSVVKWHNFELFWLTNSILMNTIKLSCKCSVENLNVNKTENSFSPTLPQMLFDIERNCSANVVSKQCQCHAVAKMQC